jgi:hypothetical protein
MAQIKDALAGRYELRHIIGRGGMGVRGARRPRANGPKLRRRLAVALGVAVLLVAGGLALSLSGSRAPMPGRRAAITHHKAPTNPPASTPRPAPSHRSAAPQRSASSNAASSSASAAQPGVVAAIDALTALLTRDLQSGQIDQLAARQIEAHLQDAVGNYAGGHSGEALRRVRELDHRIAKLTDHGHISATALAPIVGAVNAVVAALQRSGPQPAGGPTSNSE